MKILWLLSEIDSAVPSHHAVSLLSSIAKKAGHETALIEVHRMQPSLLDSVVISSKPDVLAATAVSQQAPFIAQFLNYAKSKWPHIHTVLGGTHATFRHNFIDDVPGLDAQCTNEGERPFVEYLQALECGKSGEGIPNMRVRVGTELVGPTQQYSLSEEEMAGLPFEDRLIFQKWQGTPKGIPLESKGIRPRFWFSRGCMFQCSFCAVPGLRKAFPMKRYNRYPTVDRAIAELESVADRWTFSTWVADDDVISQRKTWLTEFANKYPSRLKHLGWECNLRIETADEEVMRAFKETNCTLLKFGLESGSYDYRKRVYRRNITNEQTEHVFALARKHGLHCHTFNILSGPGETRRNVWQTVRLNQRIKPDRVQISIFLPLVGTELGEAALAQGHVDESVTNYFSEPSVKPDHMFRWEVKLYFRFFRLAVYARYSPRLAWQEIMGLAKWLRDKLYRKRTRYDLEGTTTQEVEGT